jgi:hypothetical protein
MPLPELVKNKVVVRIQEEATAMIGVVITTTLEAISEVAATLLQEETLT